MSCVFSNTIHSPVDRDYLGTGGTPRLGVYTGLAVLSDSIDNQRQTRRITGGRLR